MIKLTFVAALCFSFVLLAEPKAKAPARKSAPDPTHELLQELKRRSTMSPQEVVEETIRRRSAALARDIVACSEDKLYHLDCLQIVLRTTLKETLRVGSSSYDCEIRCWAEAPASTSPPQPPLLPPRAPTREERLAHEYARGGAKSLLQELNKK